MAIAMDIRCPDAKPVREHEFFPVRKQKEWGEDQDKLQQLMMRSVLTPRGAQASCSSSTSARDLGDCYDFDENIQAPSGWERFLDLKSGRLYLAKSTTDPSSDAGHHPFTHIANNHSNPELESRARRSAGELEQKLSKGVQNEQNSQQPRAEPLNNPKSVDASAGISSNAAEMDSRQERTIRWLQGKEPALSPTEAAPAISTRDRFAQMLACMRGESSSSEAAREDVEARKGKTRDCCEAGLDLGLNLSGVKASEKRVDWLSDTWRRSSSTPSSASMRKAAELGEKPYRLCSTPSSSSTSSTRGGEKQKGRRETRRKREEEEEEEGEGTTEGAMVTAGCSRCLMFVLLWKANPTCPRCGSPILLDFGRGGRKRARLDIGLDDRSFVGEEEVVVELSLSA